jgi:large subunit ribosomal protein L18
MALNKTQKRLRLKKRSRGVIFGTADVLRLSVYKSNKEIYAQLINDNDSKTLLTVSSRSKDFTGSGNKLSISNLIGKSLAEKAISQGINKVVFDRNGFLYHGRIKALAEGAREGGLQF